MNEEDSIDEEPLWERTEGPPVHIYLEGDALVFDSRTDDITSVLYPANVGTGGGRLGVVVITPRKAVEPTNSSSVSSKRKHCWTSIFRKARGKIDLCDW